MVLAVAGGLIAAACGDTGSAETTTFPTVSIPADAEQLSPSVSSTTGPDQPAEPTAEEGTYAPLDLGFLGGNASSSEIPSAIPPGLEVGFTEEGFPYRGSSDATVTLIEYSDYACPFCGRHTVQNVPALLEQYGVTGEVRFVFRDFPLTGLHPTAPAAHTAAICAGEQSAEFYWAVHDEVFARQAEWTGLPDPTEFLTSLGQGLGVEMTAYQDCVSSGRTGPEIEAGVAAAQALGFNGTPSFQVVADGLEDAYNLIGAQPVQVFQNYLDAVLAGEVPDGAQAAAGPGEQPEPPGLPVWADRETGLLPDPDRPGVNLAGDYYKGDPAAPLVVIEFSDFECPFCADHVLEAQPAIDAALVDTGEVMWVFKHLPLPIHPNAPTAAAASECAGDQGRFWEMHDALFATAEQWAGAGADTEAALLALAGDVGLDTTAFETCFTGRDALERVLADSADARGIISQTPSFVLIEGDRGTLLEGSRPADQFVTLLQSRIDQLDDDGSGGTG